MKDLTDDKLLMKYPMKRAKGWNYRQIKWYYFNGYCWEKSTKIKMKLHTIQNKYNSIEKLGKVYRSIIVGIKVLYWKFIGSKILIKEYEATMKCKVPRFGLKHLYK